MNVPSLLLAIVLVVLPVTLLFLSFALITKKIKGLHQLAGISPSFFNSFFKSRDGAVFVSVWAAAEAVYWYVFPDFLVIFAAVFIPRRINFKLPLFVVLGTLVGGFIAYSVGHISPVAATNILSSSPFITSPMIEYTDKLYASKDAWQTVNHPFTNVPFKVFAYTAGQKHLNLPIFLLISLVVRLFRLLVFYAVFYSIGWFLFGLLGKLYHRPLTYLLLIFVYMAFFAYILFEVSSLVPSSSLEAVSFAKFFKFLI
ncbi:hypothetical protein HYU16_04755 [Candidatus Woesearchaeota archaeon]|nr:hypothetical protein [Candidatus Woesearchaeota archaeon]